MEVPLSGLNKGESEYALVRALFFGRSSEVRERTRAGQLRRASGLTLVLAAIVLWNTVYIDKAVSYLRDKGQARELHGAHTDVWLLDRARAQSQRKSDHPDAHHLPKTATAHQKFTSAWMPMSNHWKVFSRPSSTMALMPPWTPRLMIGNRVKSTERPAS